MFFITGRIKMVRLYPPGDFLCRGNGPNGEVAEFVLRTKKLPVLQGVP